MKNDNPTSDRASCLRMSNQMDNCYNHRLDYYPYHLRVWDQTDDAILSWITLTVQNVRPNRKCCWISALVDFQIFVISDKGKHAARTNWY